MERRVGEVFECEGVKLKVVEDFVNLNCIDCYFHNRNNMDCSASLVKDIGFCHSYNREDGRKIFFKEVEPLKREEAKESEAQVPEEKSPKEESFCEQPPAEEPKPFKNDRLDEKPRWELLPLPDLEDIVKVYTFGAEKYSPNSWRELEDGFDRFKAALLRHMVSFDKGEEFDEESGLPALAHMAWNAIAMLAIWHDQRNKEHNKSINNHHEE